MSVGFIIGLVAVGVAAGMLSSLIGIGGGVIIVPVLVLLFSMDQLKAQGTSLAVLLLPVGILGVWQYYRQGYVDLRMAGLICLGFVLGSYFGARIVMNLDKLTVKRIFAVVMLLIALKMLFLDRNTNAKNTPAGPDRTQETGPSSH